MDVCYAYLIKAFAFGILNKRIGKAVKKLLIHCLWIGINDRNVQFGIRPMGKHCALESISRAYCDWIESADIVLI